MDRLKGLEYYKRIYELGSFTAVAAEFDCSNAVISKYVKFLEAWVGAKLIHRNTRSISFTDEGERFYRYCLSVNEHTEGLLDQLKQHDTVQETLSIACPVSMSLKVLSPLIIAFHRQHPSIRIQLQMSDQVQDFVESGVDIALRGIEQPEASSLIARHIADIERVLVASPDYILQNGMPSTIDQLPQHACLIFSLSADSQEWSFVDGEQMELSRRIAVSGPIRADNSLFLIEAAKAGLGIASIPKWFIREELKSGLLKEIKLDAALQPRALYALYPDRRYLPQRARLFLDFLKTALGSA